MKYKAEFIFGSNLDGEQAQEWARNVREMLPDDASFDVSPVPLIIDLDEVTDEHTGNEVRIRGFYPRVDGLRERATDLHGILEHVYASGDAPARRTFVIDGAAYNIPAYSLVELGEW